MSNATGPLQDHGLLTEYTIHNNGSMIRLRFVSADGYVTCIDLKPELGRTLAAQLDSASRRPRTNFGRWLNARRTARLGGVTD